MWELISFQLHDQSEKWLETCFVERKESKAFLVGFKKIIIFFNQNDFKQFFSRDGGWLESYNLLSGNYYNQQTTICLEQQDINFDNLSNVFTREE